MPGESAGPESIAAAVNLLHAERIGHGLTAIQDPRLVELLAEKQVAVEICLSSNLRTGCCARIEDHPLKRYFDAGVLVTLNTDDPEMFGTTLNREYQIAQEAFGFSDAQLAQLARKFVCGVVPAGGTARQLCAALPGLVGLSIPYPDLTVWAYE